MKYGISVGMQPTENEPICLISYEIALIRVGGRPDERSGFWKAYREELELNLKTKYQNEHIRICHRQLLPLKEKLHTPHFYRGNRLTTERVLDEAGRLKLV